MPDGGTAAALADSFAEEVTAAFTNYGTNTTGVLQAGEVLAALRQLRLRVVDSPQVEALLPPLGSPAINRAQFESIVDKVLNIQQTIDERRAAMQAELQNPQLKAVLERHKGTIGDLFLSHAILRSLGGRAISRETLLEMLRGLGLVPARISEESVRKILLDNGLDTIAIDDFTEVLMHLANAAAVRHTDRNVPPELRLSELLRAVEANFQASPHPAPSAQAEQRFQRQHEQTMATIHAAAAARGKHGDGGGGSGQHSLAPTPAPPKPPAFLNLPDGLVSVAGAGGGGHPSGSRYVQSRPASGDGRLQTQQSRYRPSHLTQGAAEMGTAAERAAERAAAAEITASRAMRLDAPRDLQVDAELFALRSHVATLETSLAHAEEQLRRQQGLVQQQAAAALHGAGRRSPRAMTPAVVGADEQDEHAAALLGFERVKTRVATLAAQNSSLAAQTELAKASTASAQSQLQRERQMEQRERRLLGELDSLRAKNAKLEMMLTSARVEAKEWQAKYAREGTRQMATSLLISDGRPASKAQKARGGGGGGGVGGVSMPHVTFGGSILTGSAANSGVLTGGDGGGFAASGQPLAAMGGPNQVLSLQTQLLHVQGLLEREQRESGALRAQVQALEARVGPAPRVDPSAVGLLEFASAIRPRPLGGDSAVGISALPPVGTSAPSPPSAGESTSTPAVAAAAPPPASPSPVPKAASSAAAAAAASSSGVGGSASTQGGSSTLAATHALWVDDVRDCSSQRDRDAFGAHQLVGPPRTYPMHGNVAGAWQPEADATSGGERAASVHLDFASPMYVSGVEIYETYLPGSVTAVALWSGRTDGSGAAGWDVVWRGEPQRSLPAEARIFSPSLEARSYATKHVRLELALPQRPNAAAATRDEAGAAPARHAQGRAPQIDAVRLIGMRAPTDAAPSDAPPRGAAGTAGKGGMNAGSSQSPRDGSPRQSTIFAEPGSHAANAVHGPRFRQVEAELHAVKEGHAREMQQLRTYVQQLRGYSEGLRIELDRAKAELLRRGE